MDSVGPDISYSPSSTRREASKLKKIILNILQKIVS